MPDVRLELTMPPVGDGSFTGCWESTLPSPACVGTVPERLPRRRAAPQVTRAGPSQKDKAQLLRCGGALIASPRAADRAEALPFASLVVWHGRQDLNLDYEGQNLACYRYTTRQYGRGDRS